ncbi:cation:dicarboxylase symporter family transporter [bacterium]|nr:cation:dicarboxylase symporter family transporter [bacterium]
MKLWFKYAAGILVGAAIYLVCPKPLLETGGAVAAIAEIALRIGYYILAALLCVNVPLSVIKLYEEKTFWRIGLKASLFFLASLVAAAAAGILAALALLPVRIPLLSDTSSQSAQHIGNGLLDVFPQNLGSIFANAGAAIVPALAFFLILGLAMAHDPMASKPVANLLDSLSRILHTVNVFIPEILGTLLIPISARALHLAASSFAPGIYSSFLAILAIASAVAAAVVFPLAIFLLGERKNPFHSLFANLPAALAALASGSLRFSTGVTIRQTREDYGIRRRYNAATIPLGLLLGRAGTAFVAALSFVIILSSYSQLALSLPSLLLIAAIIPAATLTAGASPQNGPIAVLTLACALFGRGFENGYLVMVPIAAVLSMFAAFLDALWIGAAQALVARKHITREGKSPRHYI